MVFSYLDVSEGSWGEDELVESTEESSHEGVGLSDINFTCVVKVEFGPGSWEELAHVSLHLGLRYLLGDKEDFGACFLGTVLLENLRSSGLTGGVGDWDGVMVEDVVHDIVLISSEESGGWGSCGSWWWGLVNEPISARLLDLDGIGGSKEGSQNTDVGEFHFD